MYFKCIRVCEKIQSQKAIFCIIPYIWYSRKDKRLGTYQVDSWRGLGVGGRDYKISSGNFVGDENILYPEYWSNPLKYIWWILCKLHLNKILCKLYLNKI